MSENDIAGIILAGSILGLLLFSILYLVIDSIVLDVQVKRHKDYFKQVEEHNNLVSKHCRYHNENIVPLLHKIDFFEREKKYYTANKIKSKQAEIRKIKLEIEKHEERLSTIQQQIDETHLKQKEILEKKPKLKKYLIKHDMWRD